VSGPTKPEVSGAVFGGRDSLDGRFMSPDGVVLVRRLYSLNN
jgi:hypothetical protein